MGLISKQLAQLIQMVSNGQESGAGITEAQVAVTTSPPRPSKRLKQNRTPEKQLYFGDLSTQDSEVASATSCLEDGMEGCEE